MRKIDADELEELFREVIGSLAKKPELNGAIEHMIRASAMVIEMINDMPTIEDTYEKVAWTPIKESHPTEGGYYLVTYRMKMKNPDNDQNCVEVDYWDELGEFWQCFDNFVTAWAELPKPYKETEVYGKGKIN